MLPHILMVLLLACSAANGQSLSGGMSIEEVQVLIGRPESKMALGSKEVLVYADGTRLEFVAGKLVKENNQSLAPLKTEPKETDKSAEPLIEASDLIQQREKKTVSASMKEKDIDLSKLSESNEFSDTLKKLEADLNYAEEASAHRQTGQERVQEIAIAFAIELAITFLVISIAFQLSGFPSVFRQLLLLSLAVAVVSAIIDTIMGPNALNPVRSVAGLVVLLLLIRQLTDVREWATAIKIAIICRVVSIAIIWLVMIGAAMLLSL